MNTEIIVRFYCYAPLGLHLSTAVSIDVEVSLVAVIILGGRLITDRSASVLAVNPVHACFVAPSSDSDVLESITRTQG